MSNNSICDITFEGSNRLTELLEYLKRKSFITTNSSHISLLAAFVAGGTMAGVLDASVCDTMLSRLSPRTRSEAAVVIHVIYLPIQSVSHNDRGS